MYTTPPPPTIKTTEEIRAEQSAPRAVGDMKHGLGGARPQMSILPRTGLICGGRAIEYGADKYARGNYHGPPPAKLGADAGAKRLLGYIDAAMRHLTHVSDAVNRALGTGGDVAAACAVVDDEASGGFPASMLPHLSHALASLLIGVSCGVDDKLLPADPGQPWKALLAAAEAGLPQKDDPALERARVETLQKARLAELDAKRFDLKGLEPARHALEVERVKAMNADPNKRNAYNPNTHTVAADGSIVPIGPAGADRG